MIHAVIIDDEEKSRNILREMLTRFCPDVTIAGESGDPGEAVKLIAQVKPNLAFLDINMPNGTGFDILRAFPAEDFEVVFITAHNEYAIRAIRASALDFLLKPINISELQDCVQRAHVRLSRKGKWNQLDVLMENLNSTSSHYPGKIAIPDMNGLHFITVSDVIRIEADGNYITFFLRGGKRIMSAHHLKEYEELLSPSVFFRSHHSHIINLDHIVKYIKGDGGSVIMSDHSEVQIARRRKKLFLEIFRA